MVATPGFDSSKGTYNNQKTRDHYGDAFFWRHEKKNLVGMTLDDGKAAGFAQVKEGLKLESINNKVDAWQQIDSDYQGYYQTLSQAYQDTFANWSGDDADAAQKTFGYIVKSAQLMAGTNGGKPPGYPGYALNMYHATKQIADAVQAALGTGSDSPGVDIGPVSLGNPFGNHDGDGNADEAAFNKMVQSIWTAQGVMNGNLEWQSPTGGQDPYQGNHPTGPGATTPTTSGPHSATAPHVSPTTPTHTHTDTPTITDPTKTPHPKSPTVTPPTPTQPTDPTPVSPIHTAPIGSGGGGGGGIGGGGVGLPGIDTGSTLAGISGGGAGGGLGMSGGAGGLDGGAGTLTSGASGLGGGAGAGAGMGGAGAEGAGTGAAGAGAGARGPGMLPMRPGGRGGDDDERERSTWLTEDDDVWAGEQAPPSVIS